jgi:uncharacterized protein YbjQ (UPF0145 family)
MICPLCGRSQPDYVRECLQCHTPLGEKTSDRRPADEPEETDTIVRVERRRKARGRGDRTINRERVPIQRRHEPDHELSPPVEPPPVAKEPPSAKLVAPPTAFRDDQHRPQAISDPPRTREGQAGALPPIVDRTPSQPGEQLNQIVDRLKRVIVSTTPEVQGRPVKEYKGVVSTGAVVKLEGWASYIEGVKDIGSIRHAPFDEQIRKGRDVLITDLKIEAAKLGANGVVGLTFQLHPVQQGAADRLLWLVAIGTAVVLPE